MTFYKKISGIIGSSLQIGKEGPIIKNLSNIIEFRNSNDTDFINIKAKDPVSDQDVLTKKYFEDNFTEGPQPVIKLTNNTPGSYPTFSLSTALLLEWDNEIYKDSGFSHSNSINPSRITVDEDSTYEFELNILVRSTGQRFQTVVNMLKNGVVEDYPYGSSYIRNAGSSSDDWVVVVDTGPIKLLANDYIEFQIQIISETSPSFTGQFISDKSTYSCKSLTAVKGDKGDTGAGSNIIVEDDGSQVGTLTSTINFIGAESVTDAGSGQVNVEIKSGLERLETVTLDGGNIITPAQLNSDQDNYNPSGFSNCNLIRQDINGDRVITGFVAPPAGQNRIFGITNLSGSNNIKFANNDSGSTAANRLLLRDNGPDKSIKENETALFYYDHTSNRWRVLNRVG